jgi:hypothetical protein
MTGHERRSARPLQNRVDPFGAFHAVPEHGTLMGNRGGRLHGDDRTLAARRWAGQHWLICVCSFKDRHRDVWGKGYTELFFLDEPTALAAGHRPCFECRRAEAKLFQRFFPGAPKNVAAMDAALHAERLDGRGQRRWRARIGDLPDGAMFAWQKRPYALRDRRALPWSFAGYGEPTPLDAALEVDVLTPTSTVAALRAGYAPRWPDAQMAPRLD